MIRYILSLTFLIFPHYQGNAQVQVNRAIQPKPGPAPIIHLDEPVVFKLSNGITVLVTEDHRVSKISARLFIDTGPITEGQKAGLNDFMGEMLGEGTKHFSKAQFDEQVDEIGANVYLYGTGAGTTSLSRYFTKAFNLMCEALLHPAFTHPAFEKVKSRTLTSLKSNEDNINSISTRVANALVYGRAHPAGEFVTTATINNISLPDIDQDYNRYIIPSRAYLTIVGDIDLKSAKSLVDKCLGKWHGKQLKLPLVRKVSNPTVTEIDFIDMPDAAQSEITLINLVDIPMGDLDYFPSILANKILGGGAEARLFLNLREKHGFTYGAYSGIGSGRFQSDFNASASVRSEKTDSAIVEIINEIKRMQSQRVPESELNKAKAQFNGDFAIGLESPGRTSGFATIVMTNNLDKSFYKTYLQKVSSVSADDIVKVAKKYFNYSNCHIIVVGNGALVLSKLKLLGYPIKRYDYYANLIQ